MISKPNFKQSERGRSMVEILGVLAVIGVLSFGGIQGYKYAMDKYQANETINELNLRAHDISQRMDRLIETNADVISMEMGNTTRTGFPVYARLSPQYIDYFEIFVENVPTDICKTLLQSQWDLPYSIFVNITEYTGNVEICEQGDQVELVYEFYKDLLESDEIPEETRHKTQRCNHDNNCSCGTCNNGNEMCESYCDNTQTCAKDYDDPRWMLCCDPEYLVNGFCCANVLPDGSCCTRNGNCCPANKPLRDKWGGCHSCDELTGINVGWNGMCSEICPKRIKKGGYKSPDTNYCTLCGVEGTAMANKPLFHDNSGGACLSCNITNVVYQADILPQYRCENVCGADQVEEIYENGWPRCVPLCPEGKPLRAGYTTCYACDYAGKVATTYLKDKCENLCPNRITKNGYCVLNGCPADKPLKDKWGGCHACDELKGVNVGLNGQCSEICPKRIKKGGWKAVGNNYCTLCGVEGTDVADKPLFHDNDDGTCFSCDVSSLVYQTDVVEQYRCENVCDNRETVKQNITSGDLRCFIKCPSDKPLRYAVGNSCAACDYEGQVHVGFLNGKSCSTLCPNREVVGNYCVVKSCPSDRPLRGVDGKCYACGYEGQVSVSSLVPLATMTGGDETVDLCSSLCPEREVVNGFCVLKDCPSTKPLKGKDNICYDCNTTALIDVTGVEDNCDTCASDGRVVETIGGIKYCTIPCGYDQFRDATKKCVGCLDSGNYSTKATKIECDKCSEREYGFSENNKCMVQCDTMGTYTEGKPLANADGICFSCDYNGGITMGTWGNVNRCTEICPNRKLNGNSCVRDVCSPDKQLLGTDGNCYPCNITTPITTTKESCLKCLNREYTNGVCGYLAYQEVQK